MQMVYTVTSLDELKDAQGRKNYISYLERSAEKAKIEGDIKSLEQARRGMAVFYRQTASQHSDGLKGIQHMSKDYTPFKGTASERIEHHKNEANKAYKKGDYISARNHENAYNKARRQLGNFMRKSEGERNAIVSNMKTRGR
jgi:hypothetical protein